MKAGFGPSDQVSVRVQNSLIVRARLLCLAIACWLIAAINSQDAGAVAMLTVLPEHTPDTAAARVAIEGFRHHLQGDVAACEFVARDDSWDNHLEYRLVAAGGASKSVVVYHDGIMNRTWVYDEFLSYFARAQRYAPAVVNALKTRDAQRLARLLTADDIDYPAELAERAIENYAARFALETLQIRYEGLEQESRTTYGPDINRHFRYSIEGSMSGTPVSHEVVISHGDGLLGWRDPLVPDYRGESGGGG